LNDLSPNQAGKDLWINVPHQANDDYVTKLAHLLRYGSDGVNPYTSPQPSPVFPPLAPGRKVYLEWSNELWNGGFSQSGWLGTQADAAIAANDPDPGTRAGLTLDTIFSEMTSYAEVNVHTWMKSFSKLAAQLDPRMKDVLLLNYANWSTSGGDLFVYFNLCSGWNRYGAWGLSSDITSEAGPKWDAIAQIAAARQGAP
jgi:hypothetical protein